MSWNWNYRPFKADVRWYHMVWRCFLGPAVLIDGIILTLTLARFSPCLHTNYIGLLMRITMRDAIRRKAAQGKKEAREDADVPMSS